MFQKAPLTGRKKSEKKERQKLPSGGGFAYQRMSGEQKRPADKAAKDTLQKMIKKVAAKRPGGKQHD